MTIATLCVLQLIFFYLFFIFLFIFIYLFIHFPYALNNLAGANPPLGKLTPTSIASTSFQLVMSHPCNHLTESGSFANINA